MYNYNTYITLNIVGRVFVKYLIFSFENLSFNLKKVVDMQIFVC